MKNELQQSENVETVCWERRNMGIYDIGIIGGGTAGMTAAIYGQRAGKQTAASSDVATRYSPSVTFLMLTLSPATSPFAL